jgi:hypothetical protein
MGAQLNIGCSIKRSKLLEEQPAAQAEIATATSAFFALLDIRVKEGSAPEGLLSPGIREPNQSAVGSSLKGSLDVIFSFERRSKDKAISGCNRRAC